VPKSSFPPNNEGGELRFSPFSSPSVRMKRVILSLRRGTKILRPSFLLDGDREDDGLPKERDDHPFFSRSADESLRPLSTIG